MLQPALDDHVLRARLHARHLEDLLRSVVHLLVLVQAAEAQPDDPAVLIQGEIAATFYSLDFWKLFWLQFDFLPPIKKCQLLHDLISSAMLLPGKLFLILEWVALHLYFVVGDLVAAALLVDRGGLVVPCAV